MSLRKIGRLAIVGAIFAFVPGTIRTQTTPPVPIRELTVETKSSHVFANIFQVRQIANRQVLVNDGLRRQLLLLDDKLALSRVVLDSVAAEGGERYGATAAPIIGALADTTWFVDRAARALLVIDPSGKVVRTTASPTQPPHFSSLAMSRAGTDAAGNLVFRVYAPAAMKRIGDTTAKLIILEQRSPATTPILRANFESRATDTVGAVKQANGGRGVSKQDPPAMPTAIGYFHPLETIDEWTMLTDGTIAFVRGADYHVDFLRPGGATEAGPKLPFDWKPLSDEIKKQILDSAKLAIDSIVAEAMSRDGVAARNEALAFLFDRMSVTRPQPLPTAPSPARSYSALERSMPLIPYEMVSIKEMPDYYPPIRPGAVQGDADNNLWILPTTSAQSKAGELVYDVVSSNGLMLERVRLPQGRSIAGFGRSGVIYLASREPDGWHLERAQIRR